ncbi:uncharacterized protein LOC135376569 [Ornithodoros turicata]|uniref:uncharacterized protein LOC135376569 n=1 Tax=Ornithodoros turicata TaxID=34597 RepID=UPI00313930D3
MTDSTAQTVAATCLDTWVARFGLPNEVVTGRGQQFESALSTAFTKLLGITRLRTLSYHPACNGLVERFHGLVQRHLKQAIMAQDGRHTWTDRLRLVLLGIGSAVKSDLGCSTAELVYGVPLCLPSEVFTPTVDPPPDPSAFVTGLRQALATLQFTPTRTTFAKTSFVPSELHTASHGFLRNRPAALRPRAPLHR